MGISVVNANGNDASSEAETPLLNDAVRGSVDFKGRPSNRSKSGCWKSAYFTIGVGVLESVAYFGTSSNLISFLTGPLGQSTATAAANVNAWNGTSMLLPLLGAFIADSFLGRYWTIISASVLYILGLGILSLSAALHSHNSSPLLLEIIIFFSLYLVALAQAGHKPCLQAFGADQFYEEDEKECRAKSSFFNWCYFSMNIGMLIAFLVLSYIQENMSWELGFGIPCIIMCLALFVFSLGTVTYRFRISSDGRNPFVRIGRVFVKAVANWRDNLNTTTSIEEEARPIQPLEGTKFKFLEKALLNGSGEDHNVCSVGDINDAKSILRLVPIWCTSLGYAIVFSQVSTLFTKQGETMDCYITRGLQIPAASLQFLICLSIIAFMPIYDRVLVPIAITITKKTSGISMLQRIGTGIVLCFLSMVIAALVERQRLATAIEYGLIDIPHTTIPMSVWWLAPQYLLLGLGNVFTMVGLQEFFYDQVPSELKSIGGALFFSVLGIGNYLSSFLIWVIEKATSGNGRDGWFSSNLNRAHLDYFYWVLAGVSAVSVVAYVYFAKSYIYKRSCNI